jgi:hypothetical protein
MPRSVARFAVERMSTEALRRAAVDTVHKCRHEFGLNLYEREKALDVIEQLVNELSVRAASPTLFDPDLVHEARPEDRRFMDC